MIQVAITAFDEASETNTEQTDEFNLILENDCLEDEIQVVQGIEDYIYYLNEDTSTPDFPNMGSDSAQDKVWNPEWSQTVAGCPIDYYIYRTVDGVRSLATSIETDVL